MTMEATTALLMPGAMLVGVAAGMVQFAITSRFQARQFTASSENQTRQFANSAEREFTKPLREVQLDLYREASSAVATLATELDTNSQRWKDGKADFLRLYFGPLAMLESDEVARVMIKIKHGLDAGVRGNKLENLSLELARTCRESAAADWKVSLPPTQRQD